MAGGMATSSFGQGILAQNVLNTGNLPSASNGRAFVDGVLFDGTTFNLGVELSGGPNSGSLQPIAGANGAPGGLYKANTDPKGYTGDSPGHFALGNGVLNVPGLLPGASSATIHMNVWFDGSTAGGLFANYAAAAAGGGKVAIVEWVNAVSNPTGSPPTTPGAFDTMPSFNLVAVPEPSTFVLAGLGAAALMIFRRRN